MRQPRILIVCPYCGLAWTSLRVAYGHFTGPFDCTLDWRAAQTSSDGRRSAGGMQMSATEGAITRRPAHPMDTISVGPIGPSDSNSLSRGERTYG
jgi:hypothetical protein